MSTFSLKKDIQTEKDTKRLNMPNKNKQNRTSPSNWTSDKRQNSVTPTNQEQMLEILKQRQRSSNTTTPTEQVAWSKNSDMNNKEPFKSLAMEDKSNWASVVSDNQHAGTGHWGNQPAGNGWGNQQQEINQHSSKGPTPTDDLQQPLDTSSEKTKTPVNENNNHQVLNFNVQKYMGNGNSKSSPDLGNQARAAFEGAPPQENQANQQQPQNPESVASSNNTLFEQNYAQQQLAFQMQALANGYPFPMNMQQQQPNNQSFDSSSSTPAWDNRNSSGNNVFENRSGQQYRNNHSRQDSFGQIQGLGMNISHQRGNSGPFEGQENRNFENRPMEGNNLFSSPAGGIFNANQNTPSPRKESFTNSPFHGPDGSSSYNPLFPNMYNNMSNSSPGPQGNNNQLANLALAMNNASSMTSLNSSLSPPPMSSPNLQNNNFNQQSLFGQMSNQDRYRQLLNQQQNGNIFQNNNNINNLFGNNNNQQHQQNNPFGNNMNTQALLAAALQNPSANASILAALSGLGNNNLLGNGLGGQNIFGRNINQRNNYFRDF